MKNLKSSKFLKTFEIGQSKLASVKGGTNYEFSTDYYLPGNEACSVTCPDQKRDYRDGTIGK
jgi:hypothetical protein